MWELAACVDGINFANGSGSVAPPSDAEFDAMLERSQIARSRMH